MLSLALFFFLKTAGAVWGRSMQILGLFFFCENCHWKFDGDCIESRCLQIVCTFHEFSASNLRAQYVFAFVSSLFSSGSSSFQRTGVSLP